TRSAFACDTRESPQRVIFGRRDGEGGIRTLEAGISPPNALAGRRLQPLGHFSSGRIVPRKAERESPRGGGLSTRRRERDLNPRRTFRHVRDFQSRSLDRSDTSPRGGSGYRAVPPRRNGTIRTWRNRSS